MKNKKTIRQQVFEYLLKGKTLTSWQCANKGWGTDLHKILAAYEEKGYKFKRVRKNKNGYSYVEYSLSIKTPSNLKGIIQNSKLFAKRNKLKKSR